MKRIVIVAALVLGVGVLAAAAAFRVLTLPSGGMSPTFAPGVRVVVSRFSGPPARGDVVVFEEPCGRDKAYLKRVVAVAGDVVSVDPGGFADVQGVPDPVRRGEHWEGPEPAPLPLVRYVHEGYETLHPADATPEPPPTGEPASWEGCAGKPVDPTRLAASAPPFPWKVPPGHVFVLGDHRTNSFDSRHFGFVPVGRVIGPVVASF